MQPGSMGENVTTAGIPVLSLPKGTLLQLGDSAQIEVMGLRNPCHQLNGVSEGLMGACLTRDSADNLERKAGIMCVALADGEVCAGDTITVTLPPEPHEALKVV